MTVKRFLAALGLAGLFMMGMAASPPPASAQPACGPWNNWCEPQCGEWNAYCVGEIIEGLLFPPDEPCGHGHYRDRPGPRAYGRGYGYGRPDWNRGRDWYDDRDRHHGHGSYGKPHGKKKAHSKSHSKKKAHAKLHNNKKPSKKSHSKGKKGGGKKTAHNGGKRNYGKGRPK
ncbi:MAG TPA: hypothetical protein VMW57_03620 [Methyloceanibacter sp.]|nr:hypothetical protein [Methyloceanibacter sp.]